MNTTKLLAALCLCTPLCAPVAFANASWQQNIMNQIKIHPSVSSSQASVQAQMLQIDASGKPIYNPELEGEAERISNENPTLDYKIGLNQTLDIWGKGKAQLSHAQMMYKAEQMRYQETLLNLTAEGLKALVELKISNELHTLALEDEQRLTDLLALVEKRYKAGDVGLIDTELAFLSLAQRLNETTEIEARMKSAEEHVKAYFSSALATQQIPDNFWLMEQQKAVESLIEQHPAVQLAYYQWQAKQSGVDVATAQTKADPTIGLYAGEDGRDSLIGVQFSVPLFLRNDYQSEVGVAKQLALSNEQAYQALKKQYTVNALAARSALSQLQKHYDQWVDKGAKRVNKSATLLKRQWSLGDISTADYLRALQQRTETMVSGLNLKGQWQKAMIEWSLRSGQLTLELGEK